MEDDNTSIPPGSPFIPVGLAHKRCAVCMSTSRLKNCGGCKVVQYCGAAHQQRHRPQHKAACVAISKSRAVLEREEAALRDHPGDPFLMPADVFNAGVGRFWGLVGTRDYMRARFSAADELLRVDTVDAVTKALEHLQDMLRLCRGDNLGVRDLIPGLLLRLGREQDCYDFIKWWAIVHENSRYDWGNLDLPYLDIHGANAFEPLNKISLSWRGISLSHLANLTLLKQRMYLDMQAYEDPEYQYLYGGTCPDPDRPVGQLVRAKRLTLDMPGVEETTAVLKDQYQQLCEVVHDANQFFWEVLVDEPAEPPGLPSLYGRGSMEEAILALHYCKSAWEESMDAIIVADSDTAKFTRVYKGPDTTASREASTGPVGAGPGSNPQPRIVILCLENENIFETVFSRLVSRINSQAKVEKATTDKAALDLLDRKPPPAVILIADGAPARKRKVLERVIDHLRQGTTVVLAGCFSSMVSEGGFTRFFATVGLPWVRGSYCRTTARLRRNAVSDRRLSSLLPDAYSQKALHVKNVESSAAWYTSSEAFGEAAVVFAKVGSGMLGYIGDVNGEEESDVVVLAMCGLLT